MFGREHGVAHPGATRACQPLPRAVRARTEGGGALVIGRCRYVLACGEHRESADQRPGQLPTALADVPPMNEQSKACALEPVRHRRVFGNFTRIPRNRSDSAESVEIQTT